MATDETPATLDPCCLKGFKWNGEPVGRIDKLAGADVYITGDNKDVAILYIADALGWSFENSRLLADHYAQEADATVYLPDMYDGERLSPELLLEGKWDQVDLPGFLVRNSRANREPLLFECARVLRSRHKKTAAIGYCYGGWAVFRLGAREHQPPLVDCITAGHPTLLTKDDIDGVGVPVQLLAPEIDRPFSPELKQHAFSALQKNGVPFEYRHFPGVEHACFVRGDDRRAGEREAMVRGKMAAVSWMRSYTHHQ